MACLTSSKIEEIMIFKPFKLVGVNRVGLWASFDTTGHDTGLGTGLSRARGSGDCCDFTAAFLFNGMSDFVKD